LSKNSELFELEGKITDVLPNQMFKVKLEQGDHEVICYTGGRMRQNKIRLILGDSVKVEMSPYDLTKGRIVYRF
jgi:translation initiation factor IF-1